MAITFKVVGSCKMNLYRFHKLDFSLTFYFTYCFSNYKSKKLFLSCVTMLVLDEIFRISE